MAREDAGDSHIRKTLAHHDQQLGALVAEQAGIKQVLGQHGNILGEIKNTLARFEGKPQPTSWREGMSTFREGLTIFLMLGSVLGGAIYATVRPDQSAGVERDKAYVDRMVRIERALEDLSKRPAPEPKIILRDRIITKAQQ